MFLRRLVTALLFTEIWKVSASPISQSAEALMETLRIAVLDFDVSRLLLNPLEKGQGSIVFAELMDLDKHQLTVLRLN